MGVNEKSNPLVLRERIPTIDNGAHFKLEDMKMAVYEEPLYYEIAFSFIDAKRQIDLFEKFIKKYSRIDVKWFLDIGCGPSLQLREAAKRGYGAIGLDSSSQMLMSHLVTGQPQWILAHVSRPFMMLEHNCSFL